MGLGQILGNSKKTDDYWLMSNVIIETSIAENLPVRVARVAGRVHL